MAKKLRPARCSGAGEDRLSSLPEEILINNILPLLPIRDAQQTSILARSWRRLWSYVPRSGLDLDGSRKLVPIHRTNLRDDILHTESAAKYAEWVGRVIDAHRGTAALLPLRHFRVSFRLGAKFGRKINSWLAFALRQGVEVLELECCDTFYSAAFGPYELKIRRPTRFPNIRLLKSLTLRGLWMSSDCLDGILSACELLETLRLSHLFGLTDVSVTGPVSRLKHIHLVPNSDLRSIRILSPTPDLVSFTYPHGVGQTVHLEHAPRLVDLTMVITWKFLHFQRPLTLHPIFPYLSQLEALKLELHVQESVVRLGSVHDFPVLGRLKHLEWTQTECAIKGLEAHCVASLIKRAPLLQHLTLEVSCRDGTRGKLRARPASLREELDKMQLQLPPVIEIRGFRGRMTDCELVLHLIKDSPSLEKLIIDCRDPDRGGCRFDPYQYSEKTIKKWKRIIKEVIQPQLPSKAKLVII